MKLQSLHTVINHKKKELAQLVVQKRCLQDQEVYLKSCELDLLVVACMKMQEQERFKKIEAS